jgi:hypothetical protein
MALADEQAWFNQNRAFITQNYPGKFVLVKNQSVQGAYPTFSSAYQAGVSRFGAQGQFLVKQALPSEPKHTIGNWG